MDLELITLSMDLSIQKLTKAFNQHIIFDDLNVEIRTGSRLAITGANGSGKSTLLKILSGGLLPSSGQIIYKRQGVTIEEEAIYKYVHFVAPYNTVIEELSLEELFHMHQELGLLGAFNSFRSWLDRLEYKFPYERQIKTYSSGMKQRVKLGLALMDNRPLILLDEPGSNLDAQGKEWLYRLINELQSYQTLVIASNEQEEIAFCERAVCLK